MDYLFEFGTSSTFKRTGGGSRYKKALENLSTGPAATAGGIEEALLATPPSYPGRPLNRDGSRARRTK